MHILQDDACTKEAKRIEAIRARAQERTLRFMDSRRRLFGIDKEYLDKQVEEKREKRQSEKEEELREAKKIDGLVAYLENKEYEKNEVRANELNEMRLTLAKQVTEPKNNALASNGQIDLDSCGVASLQIFDGEDQSFRDRRKSQQRQLTSWIEQQIKEKEARKDKDNKDAKAYDEMVLKRDDECCLLAQDKEAAHAQVRRDIKEDNLARARDKSSREKKEQQLSAQEESKQAHFLSSDPFLSEDMSVSQSAIAKHRFRPDHFKGFGKKRTLEIVRDGNDRVLSEQLSAKQREEDEEKKWSEYQNSLLQLEELEEQNKRAQYEEHVAKLSSDIQTQREELRKKQEMMRADKFGAIGQGFFQGFGTSCR